MNYMIKVTSIELHCQNYSILSAVSGAWAYVEGGMGAVSEAIARAALEAGVTIKTEAVSYLVTILTFRDTYLTKLE